MPSLILQFDGNPPDKKRCGGVFHGRVLIGRKAVCDLVIDDPAVSRVHAWIEPRNGGWYIGDTGGANGVSINQQRIDRGAMLQDGDQIEIGPARLTFHTGEALPRGIRLLALDQAGQPPPPDPTGMLVNCACGAPQWVPAARAVRERTCRHCGAAVRPDAPAGDSSPTDSIADAAPTCSICQCAIIAGEATQTCPDCQLVFHADCWRENLGCSAYGCPQVNALASEPVYRPILPSTGPIFESPAPETNRTPWEHLLLIAAVLATVLGMLAFGTPALVVALLALILLLRGRTRPLARSTAPAAQVELRRPILIASLLLSLGGAIGGIFTSWAWWMR